MLAQKSAMLVACIFSAVPLGTPKPQLYDPYVSHEMTIRDLLTHRSGMGLGEGDLLFWPHTTFTRADIIYRLRFMIA